MCATVCFFVKTKDPSILEIVEFYKIDIEILQSLGYEVRRATTWADLLKTKCDFYYIWWFAYGAVPVTLGRLLGRPTIVTGAVHTVDGEGLHAWRIQKRVAIKAAMKLATRTLLISQTEAARLEGFRPRSSSIVYCALNDAKYRYLPDAVRERRIITITHLTKGNVHRKMLLKAIEAFARFVREFPDYTYVICGSHGDATELVREKVRQCGVDAKVSLAGRISDEDKVQMLNHAFAYLQPSRCEGFGLAIIEAQACGLPVITSPDPCIEEINGESVAYGKDVDGLVDCLRGLAVSQQTWKDLSQAGLENAKRYRISVRRESLRAIINAVL